MKRERFSFLKDANVAQFDHSRPLIVFDEVCILCNGFVQFVIRKDKHKRFLFASAQGIIGQQLYRHYNLPTDDFDTNLVIIDGVLYEKLDAFAAVMAAFGGWYKMASILRILPKPISNWLYDRIAKNRYAIFGKHETCPVPSPELRARLI